MKGWSLGDLIFILVVFGIIFGALRLTRKGRKN
jgi:Sec-independent protein translocase protein TatA